MAQKLSRWQQTVMNALVQSGSLNGFILVFCSEGVYSSPGIYAGLLQTEDSQHKEYIETHNERCRRLIECSGSCDGIDLWHRFDLRNTAFSVTTFNCLKDAGVIIKSSQYHDPRNDRKTEVWVARL